MKTDHPSPALNKSAFDLGYDYGWEHHASVYASSANPYNKETDLSAWEAWEAGRFAGWEDRWTADKD